MTTRRDFIRQVGLGGAALFLPSISIARPDVVEVLGKRSFTAKHFDLGNGSLLGKMHIGQIHYRDGASKTGAFQDIDTTLTYNPVSKTFAMTKASYEAEIGLYGDVRFHNVDGDMSFVLDNPNRVEARSYSGSEWGKQGKALIWTDIIQKGGHQIVEVRNGSLAKIFHFDQKPKSNIVDFAVSMTNMHFQEPTEKPTKDKSVIVKGKQTKFLSIGQRDTFIRSAKAWNHRGESIDIELSFYLDKDGKLRATKIIPQDFIDTTFTELGAWLECDTTTSYYAGSGDGFSARTERDEGFSTIRTSAGDTVTNTGTVIYGASITNSENEPNFRQMARSYFPINTSGLGTGASITSAIFTIQETDQLADLGSISFNLVSWNGTNTFNIANFGSNLFSDSQIPGDATGAKTLTFNATGKAYINKTGTTNLGGRAQTIDVLDNNPGWGGDGMMSHIRMDSSEGTNGPYLSVTYTVSSTGRKKPPIINIY